MFIFIVKIVSKNCFKKGIVSDPELIPTRMEEMRARLRNKKYPSGLINNAIQQAMSMRREDILRGGKGKKDTKSDIRKTAFFVSTFNPLIQDPIMEIRQAANVYNATQPEETKKINIRSSFRRSSSLKDMLMFRKTAEHHGSFECKDRCILCREYLHTGDSLTLKTGAVIKANERFDCLSRNMLYLAVCSGCREFYLGETGDQLSNRFTVHRQQAKFGAQIQAVKADQHFRICGKDKYSVYPFFRPKKFCTTYRRLMEESFIKKLNPQLNGSTSALSISAHGRS